MSKDLPLFREAWTILYDWYNLVIESVDRQIVALVGQQNFPKSVIY